MLMKKLNCPARVLRALLPALALAFAAVLVAPEAAAQWTRLHEAARQGPDKVREMIPGRDVNAQDSNGDTALHAALAESNFVTMEDREEIARLLVEAGADVEIANGQSETPLQRARRLGYPDSLLALLSPESPWAKLPANLPIQRGSEHINCAENYEVISVEEEVYNPETNQDEKVLDAACRINFADARTGEEFKGCWIHRNRSTAYNRSSYRSPFIRAGIGDNSPHCRNIFGDPAEFPTGGGRDAVYTVNCDAIGKTSASDWRSCVCPPEAPHPDGDNCLSDEDLVRREAQQEEARREALQREEAEREEARQEEARREAERNKLPQGLPKDRMREYFDCKENQRIVEKLNWGSRYAGGKFSTYYELNVACVFPFVDARNGEEYPGCWLNKNPTSFLFTRTFAPHGIHENSPHCRDHFGNPAKFPPRGESGAVYMAHCGAIGKATSPDGLSCECPPNAPHPDGDNCLSDRDIARREEARLKERREQGVPDELPDNRAQEYLNCKERHNVVEKKARYYHSQLGDRTAMDVACVIRFADAASGKEYAGCWINRDPHYDSPSHLRDFTDRGIEKDNPHCRDLFGNPAEFPTGNGENGVYTVNCDSIGRANGLDGNCECPPESPHPDGENCLTDEEHARQVARREKGVPDELPEEHVPEFVACDERHHAEAHIAHFSGINEDGNWHRYDEVDVACMFKFKDAATGQDYAGCWIYKHPESYGQRWPHFRPLGVLEEHPYCRDLFGTPPEFPTGGGEDAVYAINCDAIGRADGHNGSCECPSGGFAVRPDGSDGAGHCLAGEEAAWAESCLANGWTISEAKAPNGETRLLCDFPQQLYFVADPPHRGKPDGKRRFDDKYRTADKCLLHGPPDVAYDNLVSCSKVEDFDILAVGATLPEGLHPAFRGAYLNCKERHEVMESKYNSGWMESVACLFKFTDSATGQQWNGCWIYHHGSRPPHGKFGARGMSDAPDCHEIFGNEGDFPTGGGEDAVYAINCEAIGRADGHNGSCECPSGALSVRPGGADGAEHCLVGEESAWAESCLANGWTISEVKAPNGEPRLLCDFPQHLYFSADPPRSGKFGDRHRTDDKCLLHGPPDVALVSCGEAADFDGLAFGATLPEGLHQAFGRAYLNCKERHEVMENRFNINANGWMESAACLIKFTDGATGQQWNGCWIYHHGSRPPHGNFRLRGMSLDAPECRDIFGDEGNFPAGGSDTVFAVNCEQGGMKTSPDGSRCECPRERPFARSDGADGAERCVREEENETADFCLAHGWPIAEADNPDGVSAFYCDFSGTRYGDLPVGDGRYAGCLLYGPGEATGRAGQPSCEMADLEAIVAATAAGAPPEMRGERLREFIDCKAHHQARVGTTRHSDHGKIVFDPVGAACQINIRDAQSGQEFGGCWIQLDAGRRGNHLRRHDIYDDAPHCREVFGDPARFPKDARATYVFNCAEGMTAAADLRSCECPRDFPEPFEHEGRSACLTGEEKTMLDDCRERGQAIRNISPDGQPAEFACVLNRGSDSEEN